MAEKKRLARARSQAKVIKVAIRDNAWIIIITVAAAQFLGNILYAEWVRRQEQNV